jgi:predicted dehydrogenase
MSRKWKIGIVYDTAKKSLGHHGTHFAFTGLPGVELVLADPNTDDLENRMKAIGAVRHYVDYREMIEKEQPDIVAICSRHPDNHFEAIKIAAEHGCHILCEKPLSASLQEADAIAALAETHNVKIAVAHLARYALVFRTMKRMIERGDIGTPLTFYGRGKEDERGGGEDLMVLGTHILDLGAFLFGGPDYVFADVRTEGRPIHCRDRCTTKEPVGICAGDSVMATFKFAGGVNGIFESRKGLFKGTVRMGITVVGTDGMLSLRYDQERKLRISHSSLPMEDEATYTEIELHEDRMIPAGAIPPDYEHYGPKPSHYFADNNRFAALDLLQAIDENRQPEANVSDAVRVLEMIYGIYASSLAQRAISIPLEDRTHPLAKPQTPNV